jgi:hypothetical protein
MRVLINLSAIVYNLNLAYIESMACGSLCICAFDVASRTAVATLMYFEEFRPAFGILENLKTLGKKNKDSIITFLNRLGYLVLAPILKAERYGAACRRERQWFLVVLFSETQVPQLEDGFKFPVWAEKMLHTLAAFESCAGQLSCFLFEETDSRICAMRQKMQADGAAKILADSKSNETKSNDTNDKRRQKKTPLPAGSRDEDVVQWEVDHMTIFVEHGVPWPPVMTADFRERVLGLPKRMAEACPLEFRFICAQIIIHVSIEFCLVLESWYFQQFILILCSIV